MHMEKQTYQDKLTELNELFERCFKRGIHPGFLDWRYLQNPVGELFQDGLLVCVETDDEKLVANYSASPVEMMVHGETVKTALSMTTMTDPDYAGRGYFTKLANELYQLMADRGYAMVWGFPNFQSHRGFVKRLGWVDVYEIPTMQLRLEQVKREEIKFVTDDKFELRYLDQVPLADGIYVRKTRPHLRWRYANHPTNTYTNLVLAEQDLVTSFCVVKAFGDGLDIVDFQARNEAEGKELLKQAVQFALQNGHAVVNVWAPRHHFLHGLCESFGFLNREPITYLGAREIGSLPSGRKISTNYADWYLQMGDSDVY